MAKIGGKYLEQRNAQRAQAERDKIAKRYPGNCPLCFSKPGEPCYAPVGEPCEDSRSALGRRGV